MNTGDLIILLQELAYLLGVFGFFVTYSIVRGRQALINLTMGLYLALLISVEFPYYTTLLETSDNPDTQSVGLIVTFLLFTVLSTILIARLMPEPYKEGKFESFGKKLLLSVGGTILVMIFSFHVLPITDFVTPGTPIQSLFAPAQFFFWWLIAPLAFLYFN